MLLFWYIPTPFSNTTTAVKSTGLGKGSLALAEPLIVLEHICKHYRRGQETIHALEDVSLTVQRGEFVTIVGQSGSGKSTLMNIIGCLDTPTRGGYRLDGQDVFTLPDKAVSDIRNRKIGFVFQSFHLIPSLTALENVELPLIYRGVPRAQRRKIAEEALRRVGLGHRMSHKPSELSGGQQQRTAIARAIAGRPDLILADEPTGNLDTASGQEIMALLLELHREGHTLLVITHDPGIAAAAPRQVRLCNGRLS